MARARILGSLPALAAVFVITACGPSDPATMIDTRDPTATTTTLISAQSVPSTAAIQPVTSTTTPLLTLEERRARFVSIHGRVADLYWDVGETIDVVEDREAFLADTGHAIIALGDEAAALSNGADPAFEDLALGMYADGVRSAGEALIRASEAIGEGDMETAQTEVFNFAARIITRDTASYYIVGEVPPDPVIRPLTQDVGDVAYRERHPVPGDGSEFCVAGDSPCMGWFADQTGSVSDPALVVAEVQRFVTAHGLPLVVVVIGDIGRRHPIPYSTELIETWQIRGDGPGEWILVLVFADDAIALVRQGANEPVATDLSTIAALGDLHLARADINAGILAIIDGIESGLHSPNQG